MTLINIEAFLKTVVEWGKTRGDITALALVGSHARGEARPDSDVDLVILTESKDSYLGDQSWVNHFGEISKSDTKNWGDLTSVHVFYSNDLEVEFGIALPTWAKLPADSGTAGVISTGIKVLYDPDGILAALVDSLGNE